MARTTNDNIRRLMAALVAALTATAVLAAAPTTPDAQAMVLPTFTDVTVASGISFTHSNGTVCDPPIGTGSAWADYDDDGDPDLYTTNRGGSNAMWENIGDTDGDDIPEFVDTAVTAGLELPLAASLGSVFIDYDNDGDQDLYVTNWDGNTLHRNDGDTDSDGTPNFTDVTAAAGVADDGRAITSAWADFNNDGWLDFYVAKHRKCTGDLVNNIDRLYQGSASGVFTDVTGLLCGGLSTCLEVEGLGFTAGWFDYDEDSDLDLFVVNDDLCNPTCPTYLWQNSGAPDWDFTEVGSTAGASVALNGMGLAVGDYDANGTFDLAFTNVGPMVLLSNQGDGTFDNESVSSNVDALTDSITWGTVFFDHDNDGDVDLYTAAGTTTQAGLPNIMLDNVGDNDSDGLPDFADVSVASGLDDAWNGRNLSIVDVDGDGWVDVYLGNYNDPGALYRNNGGDEGNTNNWLQVTVEGSDSNRDGIGTKLSLTTTQGTQLRLISSGPTHGGGDHRTAFFGLGAETTGTLEVSWPNGTVESVGSVSAGQKLHLIEPAIGTGTVDGHVFEDLNSDGIDSAADDGLKDVQVTITDALGGVQTTTTDFGGDYSFINVAPGQATIQMVPKPHYTLTTGNETQNVTVVTDTNVTAAKVGYHHDPAYRNVTADVGITFTHSLGGICSPPIGVGNAWEDYDGDGDLDLYITNRGGANAMYENVGDTDSDGLPNFVDTAVAAGIDDAANAGHGAVFIDFDNDGDQDLYVLNQSETLTPGTGNNALFENLGDTDSDGIPNFSDVAATAGLLGEGRGITASWADFNEDGFLDVYIAKHKECTDNNNSQDRLYEANGDGTFTDVSSYLCDGAATCADLEGFGFVAGFVDYDNDNDLDIFLVNDDIMAEPTKMWRNDGPDGSGGWDFNEVAASIGAEVSLNGMGLGVGDLNNDGWFDLAFSDIGPARLLQSDGDGTFTDVSISSNIDALTASLTWGTAFLDYDNNGFEDLFYHAGSLSANGLPSIMLLNNGDETFSDISVASGLDDGSSGRAAAMADFDGDGWIDMYMGNYGGPAALYRNDEGDNGNTNNSVSITVEGTESNRDGIGTKMHLTSGGVTRIRDISSGRTHGGGDQKIAIFGIGAETSGDLVITWPNGVVENVGTVGAGAHHFVEPPTGPSGDVAGHVFEDVDGDGTDNGGTEPGLAGVVVDIVDFDSNVYQAITDTNGDYTVNGLAVGDATVTYNTPANHTLTTANDVQVITITDGTTATAADVGYEPSGAAPVDIVRVISSNKNIDQGQSKWLVVEVTGYQDGGVFTFSGNGVTVDQVRPGRAANQYRLQVVASPTADPGLHDLTVVNPDGGTDTLPDAINVIGTIVTMGDVTGHVFTDVDGNGVEDGSDTALAGVGVTITDAGGGIFTATTDSNGDYTVTGVATGTALVEYDTPAGHALTTGNASQMVTVVDQSTVAADPVGYQPIPSGDISGHVFSDADGDGTNNGGAEPGLAGVVVDIVDANGSPFSAVTDANGDFTVAGVAVGDATVTFTTPAGTMLTTGNGVQVVTVVDSGTVTTADVGYEPTAGGVVIISVANGNAKITQGQQRRYLVVMEGYVDGGSFSFSGTGLTVTSISTVGGNPDARRITVLADATAPLGHQDLTVVSGDGSTDTYVDAVEVLGS